MQLLFLCILLVGPYLLLGLLGKFSGRLDVAPPVRARMGVTLFFLVTGLGHFLKTEEMARMVPPPVPFPILLIYVTGILEMLGAIGVWIPRLSKLAGLCLIVMLLGLLPANIYSAINYIDFGGHEAGPTYLLLRIPFQFVVMAWTYFATEQRWLR